MFIQAERQRQHHFEKQLEERERRLKQQEEAFVRMDGLQETLETRISALEKVHARVHLTLHPSPRLSAVNFTSLPHIL